MSIDPVTFRDILLLRLSELEEQDRSARQIVGRIVDAYEGTGE